MSLIPETLGHSQRTQVHRRRSPKAAAHPRASPGSREEEDRDSAFSMTTMQSQLPSTSHKKETTSHERPRCHSHFVAKKNMSQLAQVSMTTYILTVLVLSSTSFLSIKHNFSQNPTYRQGVSIVAPFTKVT